MKGLLNMEVHLQAVTITRYCLSLEDKLEVIFCCFYRIVSHSNSNKIIAAASVRSNLIVEYVILVFGTKKAMVKSQHFHRYR